MFSPESLLRPRSKVPEDFRVTATLWVAITAVLILTPFSINNYFEGRPLLGSGSLAIVLLCAINGWLIHRGRFVPWLTLCGLLPATLLFMGLAFRWQGIIGALWCYPAILSFYFMLPERQAWLANVAILGVALPHAASGLPPQVAVRVAATLCVVSLFSAIFIRIITVQERRLREQATTDALTGVGNRTSFESSIEQAAEQRRRAGTAMTLVALDLDRFKAINDSLGHDAGDAVLRGVGEYLRQRVRRSDSAFRLGGEEFLVLLRGADVNEGRQFAELLRRGIASLPLLADRTVTASFGVATLGAEEETASWMKRADENLYRAKEAGRDRVEG